MDDRALARRDRPKVVADSGITSEAVHSVVATHHEREDGSGYPNGLVGTSIPLLGRIAGIVDSFDAMTNDRPYRKALAQHAALQRLYISRIRCSRASSSSSS